MAQQTDDRTLDARQRDWINHVPDKYIGCRGDHHDWPTLRPGRLPRGIRAEHTVDGGYQVIITCRNCGRERMKTTLPGGGYDRNAIYTYRDPAGYAAPPGLDLTKADYTAELYRRIAEDLRAEQSRQRPAVVTPFHGEAS
jgi:hypothetical protein